MLTPVGLKGACKKMSAAFLIEKSGCGQLEFMSTGSLLQLHLKPTGGQYLIQKKHSKALEAKKKKKLRWGDFGAT